MSFSTADLCDQFDEELQVAEPLLRDFGGTTTFWGPITTLDVYEDNQLVRQLLETDGGGRVLVIDGGGSLQRALVGGDLAGLAARNGWSGIVIHGCIRDVGEVRQTAVGVRALQAVPRASFKRGRGERDRPLHFAGITFRAGEYLYADADGIVVSPNDLLNERSMIGEERIEEG